MIWRVYKLLESLGSCRSLRRQPWSIGNKVCLHEPVSSRYFLGHETICSLTSPVWRFTTLLLSGWSIYVFDKFVEFLTAVTTVIYKVARLLQVTAVRCKSACCKDATRQQGCRGLWGPACWHKLLWSLLGSGLHGPSFFFYTLNNKGHVKGHAQVQPSTLSTHPVLISKASSHFSQLQGLCFAWALPRWTGIQFLVPIPYGPLCHHHNLMNFIRIPTGKSSIIMDGWPRFLIVKGDISHA